MVEKFCTKLIELRNIVGKKQIDIAKACNTTQETVSRWESGIQEPKISYLIMLAKYFDVTTDYLLGIEDESGRKKL